MDYKDIAFLVEALMTRGSDEAEVRNKLENLYREDGRLINSDFIKPKKVLPLQVYLYETRWGGYDQHTIFRPVMQVTTGGQTVSFVHNMQEGSLVFQDANGNTEFLSLLEGLGSDNRGLKKYKINRFSELQQSQLLNYLEAYFDLGLDLDLLD